MRDYDPYPELIHLDSDPLDQYHFPPWNKASKNRENSIFDKELCERSWDGILTRVAIGFDKES